MGGGYLKLRDTNKENELISARTLKEDRLVGVYIEDGDDYTKIDQIPNSGYTFNSEKSYCKIGDKELDMTITTDYWTMSPFYVESSTAHMFYVRSNGSLRNIWPDSELGVRPVINLKADATIKSGNGTSSTPYEV